MKQNEQGTYKWLILVTVFVSQGLTYGLTYSVGVLYKDWIRDFDSSASFLSFIGSAATGMSSILGPLYGFLLSKFTFRQCGFFGGLIMAIGMSASFLVETTLQLFFVFGVFTGVGLGLHFYLTCTMINEYFFENRLFAEGFAGSGIGLGIFIFSIFQQYLANHYTWKGAMLICGAISLHLCLNSMFFVASNLIENHPLNFWKKSVADLKKCDEKKRASSIKCIISAEVLKLENSEKARKTKKIEEASYFKRSLVLWQNPLFLMIVLSDALTWLAIFIPYVHLVERGRLEGMNENTASWLSSTIGLTSVVGRPLAGFTANYFHIYPLWAYTANQLSLGVAMLISSFWSSFEGLFAFAVIFGVLSNGYGFVKASTATLLGAEHFADAFSWMFLFESIGVMAGPSLAGYIYDETKSYAWSFRFGGIILIFSALVCFLKLFIKKFQRRNYSRKNDIKISSVANNGKENFMS